MNNFTNNSYFQLPLITSYGSNFVKINNSNQINNNILLLSDGTHKSVSHIINNINDLSISTLQNLFSYSNLNKDIFLVGCGSKYVVPNMEIRSFVKRSGFSLEWMITKSAINTWNLMLEDYRDIIFLLLWEV